MDQRKRWENVLQHCDPITAVEQRRVRRQAQFVVMPPDQLEAECVERADPHATNSCFRHCADAFGELMLKPSKRVTTRMDIHSLRLANGNDLWYQGGGAFQSATFGYVGQPVNGRRGLATLYDASADVVVTPRVVVSGYYGYAAGGLAAAVSYPTNHNAGLGYLEFVIRF